MISKKQSSLFSNEKAIGVATLVGKETEETIKPHLDELIFLAKTAGAEVEKIFLQRIDKPDTSTYVRKGKLQEILDYIKQHEITLVIFDAELSGSQFRNIQDDLKCNIVDRSTLILDIFAKHAKTAQAKLQVELAQYQYFLPRLRGLWVHLERQEGAVGSRGPGETEIETDRRLVQKKISFMRKKLELVEKQADTKRKKREEMVQVALVGYTNVGKSSLMNLLAKSDTLTEDKLFATLDTTTRKTVFNQTPFLLSDTVGFIRKLPHHLIESFKSTLQEVKQSDILLHVIDFSATIYQEQISVVNETLEDLGIGDKKMILVFNKLDVFIKNNIDTWMKDTEKEEYLNEIKRKLENTYQTTCFFISVLEKKGISELKQFILSEVKLQYKAIYPYKTNYYDY